LKPPFEILEHPSDLGIEARGDTLENLFRHAALGLMSVMSESSKIRSIEQRGITVHARDRENLLVRWLTEILFLVDAEKFLTSDITVDQVLDTSLTAIVFGEPYHPSIHELKLGVKAVTYHQLTIQKIDHLWIARVFVDI